MYEVIFSFFDETDEKKIGKKNRKKIVLNFILHRNCVFLSLWVRVG